jgi:metal-responsive CopG/Arc/MetJ family transcriptional regulator
VEMRVVTFKIERDMLELLDTLSIALKMNRSELIRYMIQYYIDHEYTPKQKVPTAKVEKGVKF